MTTPLRLPVLAAVLFGCASTPEPPVGAAAPAPAQKPAAAYRVYVANESSDLVSKVTFTPGAGARLDADVPVGIMPADIDGPHGLTFSPDGRFYYVSLAHGTPWGRVWKYAVNGDSLVGQVDLGMFPATMSVSPDGQFLYVVNFNLHGDPVPSSVSVVYTPSMTEVARPTTCVMPHGSRINASGTRQYSACMHDDQLVEVDTRTFQVTSRFLLKPGAEAPLPADPSAQRGVAVVTGHAQHGGAAGMDMSVSPASAAAAVCSPTWAQPGAGAWSASVYVLCNKNAEVLEVDTRSWKVTRRFATAKGPYNAAVSPDGRLLVITNKASQSVGIIDLQTGTEVARIATSRPITHGVVISRDGLYAFVTNEAVGSTHGTVDVIDLKQLTLVASVDVQYQPGGIDLLPMP